MSAPIQIYRPPERIQRIVTKSRENNPATALFLCQVLIMSTWEMLSNDSPDAIVEIWKSYISTAIDQLADGY